VLIDGADDCRTLKVESEIAKRSADVVFDFQVADEGEMAADAASIAFRCMFLVYTISSTVFMKTDSSFVS
jgi:hypothetical protein